MLIDNAATVGGRDPSSQPPEHTATISAADTVNTATPAVRRTAAHAAPICATASAAGLPAGISRSKSIPVLASRSSRANPTRIGSACAANRDSQPRTVEAGRPAAALTRRQPCPAARASSAAQITATASTRRPSTNRGNSTCERPQPPAPEQIARRGRIRRSEPAASRTNRAAACPHGASRSPHPGQASSPEINCCSTWTQSVPTLSNGPPPGAFERPFPVGRTTEREGPLAIKITPEPNQPILTLTRPTAPALAASHVLTASDRKPLGGRHPQRRSTPRLIEFGPREHEPAGLSPDTLLSPDAAFEVAGVELSPLASWGLSDADAERFESVSDAAVSDEGALYLVSSKSCRIARVEPAAPGDDHAALTDFADLPSEIPMAEDSHSSDPASCSWARTSRARAVTTSSPSGHALGPGPRFTRQANLDASRFVK